MEPFSQYCVYKTRHHPKIEDNVDITVAAAVAADDDDDNSDYVNKSNILFSRCRHFISLFCWLSQSVSLTLPSWVCNYPNLCMRMFTHNICDVICQCDDLVSFWLFAHFAQREKTENKFTFIGSCRRWGLKDKSEPEHKFSTFSQKENMHISSSILSSEICHWWNVTLKWKRNAREKTLCRKSEREGERWQSRPFICAVQLLRCAIAIAMPKKQLLCIIKSNLCSCAIR